MGNIGVSWYPEHDLNLKTLQAQLESQLEQQRVDIATQQGFQNFTKNTITDLLQQQGTKRLEAIGQYSGLMRQNYINQSNAGLQDVTQSAQAIVAGLNNYPARQAAVATINAAASGQGIAGVQNNAAEAIAARGGGPVDVSNIQQGLATSAQEIAAPISYQMSIEDTLRPFQLQAQEAQTRNTIAQTSAQNVGQQAQSLAEFTQYANQDTNILGSLYGASARAFKEPAVSQSVTNAKLGTYGYENPNPFSWF